MILHYKTSAWLKNQMLPGSDSKWDCKINLNSAIVFMLSVFTDYDAIYQIQCTYCVF